MTSEIQFIGCWEDVEEIPPGAIFLHDGTIYVLLSTVFDEAGLDLTADALVMCASEHIYLAEKFNGEVKKFSFGHFGGSLYVIS